MTSAPPIAAVILAAGESRRFGSPKQLAIVQGRTLLEHAIDTARSAGLTPIVAVVPVWLTRPSSATDPALGWVRNPHPERGMSHSLRLGFAALPEDVVAAVIMLGDQPGVPASTIRSLVAARGQRPIVGVRAEGRLGSPVLVERSHFHIVDEPRGDVGLRELLNVHPEWVTGVGLAAHPPDVDTPADLDRLSEGDRPQ